MKGQTETPKQRLSEVIQSLLDDLQLSSRQLAKKLQVSAPTVGEYLGENGKSLIDPSRMRVCNYRRLAKLKGWKVGELDEFIYGDDKDKEDEDEDTEPESQIMKAIEEMFDKKFKQWTEQTKEDKKMFEGYTLSQILKFFFSKLSEDDLKRDIDEYRRSLPEFPDFETLKNIAENFRTLDISSERVLFLLMLIQPFFDRTGQYGTVIDWVKAAHKERPDLKLYIENGNGAKNGQTN